jgi:hypothetical protein
MKFTFILFSLFYLAPKAFSQSEEIILELTVEGKSVEIKNNFFVKVIVNKDTIPLKTTEKGFYIPDSLMKTKRLVMFKIDDLELPCETFLTYQKDSPRWLINVDFRPFLEENKRLIKGIKNKVYWIYTLNKSEQFLLTYHRFDKFRYSRKPQN